MTDTLNLMQENWSYLIVLDACRYDYFESVYKKYLTGNLEKRISVGTGTSEWRDRSFLDYYDDIIYISANPYINSVTAVRGFCGKDHFNQVFDLWLEDWDYKHGTVLPEKVTQRAKEIISANTEKRAIIHYIQPHEPYLTSKIEVPGFKTPKVGGILQGVQEESWFIKKFMTLVSGLCYWLGIRGNLPVWKIREFLGLGPSNPMDAVRRKYGDEALQEAYKENLEAALPHIAELVEHLSGRIIITADHGEMLGEEGCYCHWSRANKRQLLEIPWLVIDKGEKSSESTRQKTAKDEYKLISTERLDEKTDDEAKRKIQERLRALGYYD
jgi:hypothetical protein